MEQLGAGSGTEASRRAWSSPGARVSLTLVIRLTKQAICRSGAQFHLDSAERTASWRWHLLRMNA